MTGFSQADSQVAGEIASFFRDRLDRVDDPRMRRAIELEIGRWTRVARIAGLRLIADSPRQAS